MTPWGLPYWLLLTAGACRLRRRPFLLLDVGAEPCRDRLTRWMYHATVRLAAHVSYRDAWSAEAMSSAGASRPAAVAPDLAFAHPSPDRAEPVAGRVVVGVMAYYGPSDDPVRGAHVMDHYVTTLQKVLVECLDGGDHLVLIGGDRLDLDIARRVADGIRSRRPGLPENAVTIREATTFEQVSHELAGAEVAVVSRFHNLIGALRLARPVVSLGYAEKNWQLMAEMGLKEYAQHLDHLDADRLATQMRAARAGGQAVSERIATATESYPAQVRALLRHVALDNLHLPDRGASQRPPSSSVRVPGEPDRVICTSDRGCGLNGVFSQVGTYPDWSPYKGYVVPDNITFHQRNVWRSNRHTGPWRFMARTTDTSST